MHLPDLPAAASSRGRAFATRALVAVLAGLVLDSGFAPLSLWAAAPVGVAMLALACRGASVRAGAALGVLAGLGLFLPLLSWTGLQVGALPWLLLVVSQAAFLAALGAALPVLLRLPASPVWVAAAWVAQEAARGRIPFGGFPWGRLAFSQPDTALTRLAALGGAPLVTAAVGLLGGALAAMVGAAALRDRQAATRGLAWLVGCLAVVGGLAVVAPVGGTGPSVRIAVVQGNVPRLGLEFNAQRAAVLLNHVQATRQLAADVRAGRVARPDLVVWPENSSDVDPFEDPAAYAAIDGAVRDIGVPVLVGAVLDGPGNHVSNTGIVWDPVMGPGARYVKRHPVPFGEYIPLRSLARLVSPAVDLVPRDFAAGDRVGLLDLGPARLGDVICFEVAYDGLVRDTVLAGGRLLVVQTNNATFERSAETEQQLAMGQLRAVEHGRSVVVAATSGVSAVIRPDGSLAYHSQIFTRDVAVVDVPLRDAQTPATRLGALPEAALTLLALAGLAAGVLATRRRREAAR